MKLLKACIALAAFAAIFVVPSIASATSPRLYETTTATGTGEGINSVVPEGTKIAAFNVAHASTPLTTVLKSNLGNIECETATLTGELTKNKETVIEGNITTAEFLGKPNSSPHSERCSGGFGGDTLVTPRHTSDTIGSLPWCLKVSGLEDKFTVRGGKCSEAARGLKFTLDTSTLGACSYEKAAAEPVVGTYTTHPSDAILTIANQKFAKTAGSVFCPSTGELFMSFTVTTDEDSVNHLKNKALNIT
jgi:hypothetical protein